MFSYTFNKHSRFHDHFGTIGEYISNLRSEELISNPDFNESKRHNRQVKRIAHMLGKKAHIEQSKRRQYEQRGILMYTNAHNYPFHYSNKGDVYVNDGGMMSEEDHIRLNILQSIGHPDSKELKEPYENNKRDPSTNIKRPIRFDIFESSDTNIKSYDVKNHNLSGFLYSRTAIVGRTKFINLEGCASFEYRDINRMDIDKLRINTYKGRHDVDFAIFLSDDECKRHLLIIDMSQYHSFPFSGQTDILDTRSATNNNIVSKVKRRKYMLDNDYIKGIKASQHNFFTLSTIFQIDYNYPYEHDASETIKNRLEYTIYCTFDSMIDPPLLMTYISEEDIMHISQARIDKRTILLPDLKNK